MLRANFPRAVNSARSVDRFLAASFPVDTVETARLSLWSMRQSLDKLSTSDVVDDAAFADLLRIRRGLEFLANALNEQNDPAATNIADVFLSANGRIMSKFMSGQRDFAAEAGLLKQIEDILARSSV